MENQCVGCGKACRRKWCSQACNAASRRNFQVRQCLGCGSGFEAKMSEIKRGGGVFCSLACRKTHKAAHSRNYLKVGRKAVHRIVAEAKLGRALFKGEVVHHIDGDRLNNDPENLIVLPSQSAHMRLEVASGHRKYPTEIAVRNGKKSGEARRLKKQKAVTV